jgi:hypothetical protein
MKEIPMSAMVEKAQTAMEEPEVLDMLKRLSAYGLGIYLPHMHTETEDFVPLPKGMVQLEKNLVVSFCEESEAHGSTVGWVWDGDLQAAQRCTVCVTDTDGGHKSASTSH